jgi:2-haloacid dehalogenase
VKLTDFDVMSFDCYGTLIDWESGILTALRPLLARTGPRDDALPDFARAEAAQQAETPAMPYAQLLVVVHDRLARSWGAAPDPEESRRFGASIGDWPAFPDTPGALRYLKQHFRLVILSNVDRDSFRATSARLGDTPIAGALGSGSHRHGPVCPGHLNQTNGATGGPDTPGHDAEGARGTSIVRPVDITFDAVHTAQDIGSYKPDPRNFAYLSARVTEMGVPPDRLLHVAQSLFHDHAPANAAGIASAWIDRHGDRAGWGATSPPPPGVRYDFRFSTLGELAAAHQAETHLTGTA